MKNTYLYLMLMRAIVVSMTCLSWGADRLPSLVLEEEEVVEQKPAATVTAATPATTAPLPVVTETPVEALKPIDPSLAIEVARAQGIEFLKALAEKDLAGFVAPPVRHVTVVGYEQKLLRFSEKLIDVPIYEIDQVFRNVQVGESVGATKVRKKIGVRRQVGTKKEKRIVRDANGELEIMTKVPLYGEGGPDEWRAFLFGHNAMAVYAMMKAGVDPSENAIAMPLETLLAIYEQYGMPDTTWDLAWSLAAFSEMKDSRYQNLAREMAGKLMDGQIDDGAAAGLWGPVCISTPLFSAMLKKQDEYSKFYLAAQEKFIQKKNPGGEVRMQAGLDALKLFEKLMKRATMLGTTALEGNILVLLKDELGIAFPILVANLPSYIANQTAADMESTAIALFGLRIAIEKKLLPEETWRPVDEKGVPLVPPKTKDQVFKNAASAITKAQSQGAWSEMNRHQPVVDFESMKSLEGLPANLKSFVPLPSIATETSTAQGYSAFSCFAEAYGMGALGVFTRNMVAANTILKTVLESGIDTVKGGQSAPYDFCFFMSKGPDLGSPEYDLKASQGIVEFLVENQNEDGSWGGKPPWLTMLPSSLRERMAILPASYVRGVGIRECDLALAHVLLSFATDKNKEAINRTYYFSPKIMNTAYALLSLAETKKP